MSAPVRRIEKDFFLKVLYDEKIPVMLLRSRTEYIFTLTQPVKNEMLFKPDRPVRGLVPREKINLMFDYSGRVLTFSAEVRTVSDNLVTVVPPEYLYKSPARSFSRKQTPSNIEIYFIFSDDRFSLSYPKVGTYDTNDPGEFVKNMDPKNLSSLIDQMAVWIKGYADGYKLLIFKNAKPASTEEKLVAQTGKALFLPSTHGPFPQSDPHPRSRLVTEEIFKQYLESKGIGPAHSDEVCTRFLKTKFDSGIFSDLWVPLLFQEYVIGYIHAWINEKGKLPFDYTVVDTIFQFSAIIANSLKINGFFETGKLRNETFDGKVIDISTSGLLFVCSQSTSANSLLPDTELSLKLVAQQRTITTNSRIVRRYKDKTMWYFDVKFLGMAPEDIRFLFEYIYGKPFIGLNTDFLFAQV